MPTLPVPQGPDVAPSGPADKFETIEASPDAFGAQVGQATQNVGQAGQQYAQVKQAIANEGELNQRMNQALQTKSDIVHGTQDKFDPTTGAVIKGQPGFNSLLGQDAVNAYSTYQQKLQDSFDQIRTSITNPAVVRQFQSFSDRLLNQAQSEMGSHKDQQAIVNNMQQSRAQVALYQQNALNDADDPQKWAADLANVQLASERASEIAGHRPGGLDTDLSNAQYKQDMSTVFEKRTEALMTQDPMKAADFYHNNIGMILPENRNNLERQLKTTTDAQYSRGDGATAYQSAIGQAPNNAPLPAKIDGADLAPFDQSRIQQIKSFVMKSSPYDAAIQDAAKTYNVNPNEIKLKIAIESGGDPKATSSAGAVGLGQFMPDTATQYGITDRTDPVQSINGIAKFLAANGGTVGNNMAKADKAYIGTGPDADQYVENTRAARQALMGPQANAPLTAAQLESQEGAVVDAAKAQANLRRPGDMVYQDQVVAEAHKNWSQDLSALRGQDYANYSTVLGASIGPNGAKSLSSLSPDQQMTYAKLPPQSQQSLQNLWKSNQSQGVIATPDTDRQYLTMMGQAITDPVAFKARDIAQDIQTLPKQQQAQVMAAYVSIDKNAAEGAKYTQALSDLRPTLEAAKIRIPNAGEKGDFSDYNAFAGKLKPALDNFMDQNKRQPTQQDIDKIAAPLLADFTVKGGSWGGFADKTVKGFKLTPDQEPKVNTTIPPTEMPLINSAFQNRYGRPPQPSEAQQMYMMAKLHPGDRLAAQSFDQAVRQNTLKINSKAPVQKIQRPNSVADNSNE